MKSKTVKVILAAFLIFAFSAHLKLASEEISSSPVLHMSLDGDLINSTSVEIEASWLGVEAFDSEGAIGEAIKLNGLPMNAGGNAVEIVRTSELYDTDSLTLSLWFKKDQASGNGYIFWNHSRYGISIGSGSIWPYIKTTSERHQFGIPAAVEDTEWHHVVMTLGNETLTVYLDGGVIHQRTVLGDIEPIGSWNPTIGGYVQSDSFPGAVDEVSIYRDELTSEEVQILYHQIQANLGPTLSITDPDGIDDTAEDKFIITWVDEDSDSDASISLYFDTDNTGANGIQIANGISEDDPADNYVWDTSAILEGDYYIYAVIDDGINVPVVSYSNAPVSVSHDYSVPVLKMHLDDDLVNATQLEIEASWLGEESFVPGAIGQAIKGNGLPLSDGGKAVEIKRIPEFYDTDSLTLSLWFKKDEASGNGCIFWNHSRYGISIGSDSIWPYINTTSERYQFGIPAAVEDTEWHHVAMTFGNEMLRVYLDGEEIHQRTVLGDIEPIGYWNPTIGAKIWEDSFPGAIDEVAIYRDKLTPEEVLVLSRPSIALLEPNGDDDVADENFIITWTDGDPDNDAAISLYYDRDNTGENGTLIVSGLSEDDPVDSYLWNTSSMPEGNYYIYAVIDDGVNVPVTDYSEGTVNVSHPEPSLPPNNEVTITGLELVYSLPSLNHRLDVEEFIGNDSGIYFAFANNSLGNNYERNSEVFKLNYTTDYTMFSLDLSASVATFGAQRWAHFNTGSIDYLAIANRNKNAPNPYYVNSAVYSFSGTGLTLEQTLDLKTLDVVQHANFNSNNYLFTKSYSNDYSEDYVWDSVNKIFTPIDLFNGSNASVQSRAFKYQEYNGHKYVAQASASGFKILKWNDSSGAFEEKYSNSVGTDRTDFIVTSAQLYVFYRENGIAKIFKVIDDGVTVELEFVNDIPEQYFPHNVIVFNIETSAFIIFSDHHDSSDNNYPNFIYTLEDGEFVKTDVEINNRTFTDAEHFVVNGEHFLILATANPDNMNIPIYKIDFTSGVSGPTLPVTADLTLRLDASDANSIITDTNEKISRWEDLSGNDNHAIQSDATLRPTILANGLNGKSTVDFEANSFNFTTNLLLDDFTIFIITKNATDTFLLGGYGADNYQVRVRRSDTKDITTYSNGGEAYSTLNAPVTDHYLVTYHRTGNTFRLFEDGTEAITSTVGTFANRTYNLKSLATLQTLHMTGEIAEVVIYNRALTDAETADVHTYLMDKWLPAP